MLRLNLRWFTPEIRQQLLDRIDAVNRGVAIAAGVPEDRMPTRVMKGSANPLVNDAALAARINPSLAALLGEGRLLAQFPAVMGSEDFQEAFAGLGTPYSFMLIGVAPAELVAAAQKAGQPFPYSNHNPDFLVDLAAIPVGARVNTVAVLSLLARR